MNYYLGIDIGTSSVKVLAINEDGETLERQAVELATVRPKPAYAEQNPQDILAAIANATKRTITKIGIPPDGISFSCAMHGLICVDENDKLLTNCILWSDARSAEVAQSLRKNKLGDLIFAATGTPIHAMSPLCKIRWLQENASELFSATACFFDLKSWLIQQMFSVKVIDYSLASATGLFNSSSLDWEQQALDFCGISRDQLPQPVPTSFVLPEINPAFSQQSNLPKETPAVIGASDGCLANLGAGALSVDAAALTIGTSAAIRTSNLSFSTAQDGSLFTYILEDKKYLLGGASNNGGNVIEWLSSDLFGNESISNLIKKSTQIPAGAAGLLFYPYIFGERAPLWDAESRGTYRGISGQHKQLHFAKATLEGILFNLRLICERIEASSHKRLNVIIAGGGFFRSQEGAQLTADILHKKIIVRENHDSSAYGAVLMCLKNLHVISEYSDKDYWQKEGLTYYPQVNYTDIYEKWRAYIKLYE